MKDIRQLLPQAESTTPHNTISTPSEPIRYHGLPRRYRLRTPDEVKIAAQETDPALAVPRLLAALGHSRNDIREAAAAALPAYGETAFQGLLWALEFGTDRQRKEAATSLGEWQDRRAVEPLMKAIQRAEKDRFKPTKWGYVGLFYFSYVGFFIWLLGRLHCFSLRDTSALRACAAHSLGKIGDVRAIGLLARIASSGEQNYSLLDQAEWALLALLPGVAILTPEQAEQLGPRALPTLAALLAETREDLAHSILQAFRAVGDGRVIAAVEKLERNHTRSVSLREEAANLLPVLQERAAREQARTTLVRGADAPRASAPAELLRPAHNANRDEDAPETLLRAVTSSESRDP